MEYLYAGQFFSRAVQGFLVLLRIANQSRPAGPTTTFVLQACRRRRGLCLPFPCLRGAVFCSNFSSRFAGFQFFPKITCLAVLGPLFYFSAPQ